MDKHLDFTIDFETCALSANAAPMSVAVVPWVRYADANPFSSAHQSLVKYVDLRTCVVDGFDFDHETVKWWAERSNAAKAAVCDGKAEPIEEVLIGIVCHLRHAVRDSHADSICLWAHGSDLDISIMRSLCRRYDVNLESIVPHTSFRDCRTVIIEAALIEAERRGIALSRQKILATPSLAYDVFGPLPSQYAGDREAHDALYDATRSSWYTWQALRSLQSVVTK